MTPVVDLVIATHDLRRPVERATATALAGTAGAVRVTLACHFLDADEVLERLAPADRPYVRAVEVRHGRGTPAAPFNAGLDLATARYVAVMGSDDLLEPGALPSWARRADTGGADVVLAPLRQQDGTTVRTPRARPWRQARLDLVRDRLSYRTAPLGVLRRESVERLELRFTTGVALGEDAAFSARLFSAARRVDYARAAPRYVIGQDAAARTTTAARPLPDQLAAYRLLIDADWFGRLPDAQRRAVAVKILRIHVFGAVSRHALPGGTPPTGDEVRWLAALADDLLGCAAGVARGLSRAERRLTRSVVSAGGPGDLVEAAVRYRDAGRLERALTELPWQNLDRESVLRHYGRLRLESLSGRA